MIAMLQPKKKWAKVFHVFVFTLIFSIEEYMLLKTGAIEYIHWDLLTRSIPINILAVTSISWFSIVVLDKGR